LQLSSGKQVETYYSTVYGPVLVEIIQELNLQVQPQELLIV